VRADCHATMDEISGERFVKLCAKIDDINMDQCGRLILKQWAFDWADFCSLNSSTEYNHDSNVGVPRWLIFVSYYVCHVPLQRFNRWLVTVTRTSSKWIYSMWRSRSSASNSVLAMAMSLPLIVRHT
jgi:hypothetical protein